MKKVFKNGGVPNEIPFLSDIYTRIRENHQRLSHEIKGNGDIE